MLKTKWEVAEDPTYKQLLQKTRKHLALPSNSLKTQMPHARFSKRFYLSTELCINIRIIHSCNIQ